MSVPPRHFALAPARADHREPTRHAPTTGGGAWPLVSGALVATALAFHTSGVRLPLDGATTGWARLAGAATALVSHESATHLIPNVTLLLLFGVYVELAYGRRHLLVLLAAEVMLAWGTTLPGQLVLGASVLVTALAGLVAFAPRPPSWWPGLRPAALSVVAVQGGQELVAAAHAAPAASAHHLWGFTLGMAFAAALWAARRPRR